MHPNYGRVVINFILQALQGKVITIYGDGQQTRSFCYVDDLIDAMVKMMNSEDGFTGPVNTGNPGEFTMLQLAETVLRLSGSKSKIIHQPLPTKSNLKPIGLQFEKYYSLFQGWSSFLRLPTLLCWQIPQSSVSLY
jgi:nucleoside-diphosphate-sugar epimerase